MTSDFTTRKHANVASVDNVDAVAARKRRNALQVGDISETVSVSFNSPNGSAIPTLLPKANRVSVLLPDAFLHPTINVALSLLQRVFEWFLHSSYRIKTTLNNQWNSILVAASYGSTDGSTVRLKYDLHALKARQLKEYYQPVFISPMGKANLRASDDDLFPLMEKVEEFLASDRQVMLILGDSGAGKSTFNRHLEHYLWTNYKNGDPVPLFINLPTIHKPQDEVIWKQLDIHGFSNDQILHMKLHQQLILICDGYDECQLTINLHKTNRLNQPNQWRTKMIISCRSQFLGSVYVDRFAPQTMDRYAKVQQDLFQEVVIAPFSNKQVEDYVARYVPLEPRPWVTEDYMRMLTTIPNLMDLVKNPFLLTLTLEALPGVTKGEQDLSNIIISRVQLYDHFVNEWLGVNMRRLRNNSLTDDEREMLEHMMEKGFIFLGIDYSKRLALAIFEKHDGNPVVPYVHFDHKHTWRAAFFGPEPEARLLRESSPLTRSGSLFRFIHRSMLEYFFSRTVFDPTALGDDDGFAPQPNLGSPDLRPIDPNGPFFTRNLIKEPSVIQFLCERVKESPHFEEQLRAVVELSKADAVAATAAANAMTILVQAEVLFHEADLQGVRIPGADVSGGQFDHARFQGADLTGVNFAGSWLRKADISYAQLKGVRFGKSQYLDQGSEVGACAFSPDGRVLALSLRDRSSINVYDTATWTRTHSICLFEKDPSSASETSLLPMSTDSIAFSPNSKQFVTANSDRVVRLWDCVSGKALLVMKGHKAGVHSVAFSPRGTHIASSSRDKTVRHWSAETGETVSVMKGHTDAVRSVKYSPDGRILVSGGDDGTIRIWDPQKGEAIDVWVGSQGPILCLAFASDGQRLACGYKNGDAQLWDTLTEDAGRILSGHTYGDVTGIAFSPNGRWVATSSADYAVRLWDAMAGEVVSTFSEHTDKVWDVTFSPDGRQLASGGEDGFVRLWDVNSSETNAGQQDSTKIHLGTIFLADGLFILSNQGSGSFRLWNPLTGAVRAHIHIPSEGHRAVAISPDGAQIASGGSDGTLLVWYCQTGAARATIDAHAERVDDLAYSPCGRWILSMSSKTVHLWNLQEPRKKQLLAKRPNSDRVSLMCIAYSPTGRQVAIGDSTGSVRIFDPRTGSQLKTTTYYYIRPASLTFSPNGQQLAIGSRTHWIELWDYQSEMEPSTMLHGHGNQVLCAAYSPCGQWLASSSVDATVRLWRRRQQQCEEGAVISERWRCAAVVKGIQGYVNNISWNSNGPLEFVTISSDKSVRVWRIAPVDEKDSHHAFQVSVHLVWSSNLGQLCVQDLKFKNVVGLSPLYEKLLLQRGAVETTVSLDRKSEGTASRAS